MPGRTSIRLLPASLIALAVAALAQFGAPATEAAADQGAAQAAAGCKGERIRTADGCVRPKRARKEILAITRQLMAEKGLRAAILQVRVGRRTIVSKGLGTSVAGVKASPRMNFRIGSMAITLLTNLLLQLRDEGRLRLDAPLSKWFPGFRDADRVTLRMLASSTTGYPDYAQGNPTFGDVLDANPFKQWNDKELLDFAFAQPSACEPVTCFHYAHTNFVLLGKVLSKVTGQPVRRLMRRRVLGPLGLKHTRVTRLPGIPSPVLHAYLSDRGFYEDATFWSPSWGVGAGVLMTSKIADIVKEARAIGKGRLLSRESARLQVRNHAAGLPGQLPPTWGYGLGILLTNGWQFQNPFINGFDGLMAHLPRRGITIAGVLTHGFAAAEEGKPVNRALFERVGNYLAPSNPIAPAP